MATKNTARTTIAGRPAYADGPGYTSPEMQPGHGDNRSNRTRPAAVGMTTVLSMPGGGPVAMEALASSDWDAAQTADVVPRAAPRQESPEPRFGFVRHVLSAVVGKPAALRTDAPAELQPLESPAPTRR
jgi:hypothetical protein